MLIQFQTLSNLRRPAGIANCAIGIDLINSLQGDAIANWVAPAAAVLGLIVVAGIALELRRTQVRGRLRALPC